MMHRSCLTCLFALAASSGSVAAGGSWSPVTLRAGDNVSLTVAPSRKRGVDYSVSVDGAVWLQSAAVAVTHNHSTYTSDWHSVGPALQLVPDKAPAQSSGSDVLGAWRSLTLSWMASAVSSSPVFTTTWKVYTDTPVLAFEQGFPLGSTGFNPHKGTNKGLASMFPSWARNEGAGTTLQTFTGQGQSGVAGGAFATASLRGGIGGGSPLVLYQPVPKGPPRSVVLSPLSNFMVGALSTPLVSGGKTDVGTSAAGIVGSVTELPKGFTHSTVLVGGSGVSSALMDWGDVLLKSGGKTRTVMDHPTDISLTHIGYWTDNGAWYHYLCSECCGSKGAQNPCPCPQECAGTNTMEQTMLDVKADMQRRGIPMKYFMFDSWWYPKAGDPGSNSSKPWPIRDSNGMLSWTPEPQVFPDGDTDWLQLPTFLHARYLAPETSYLPKYKDDMLCEVRAGGPDGEEDEEDDDDEEGVGGGYGPGSKGICLPQSKELFEHMMDGVSHWSPFVYEQDWISTTFGKSKSLTNNTQTGVRWLTAMNDAAASRNLTIQYSMSFTPAQLQSTTLQAVTQIRGSSDYTPGSDSWNVGPTSTLYFAMGVFASKDTLYTKKHQPGCPKAGEYNCTEPNTEIQMIAATLSGGPVGPGDRLNLTDRVMVMRSCNGDGRILRPERPLTLLDAAFPAAKKSPSELTPAAVHSSATQRQSSGSASQPTHGNIRTLWGSYSSFLVGGARTAFHYVFYTAHEGSPSAITLQVDELLESCSTSTLGARRCGSEGGATEDDAFLAAVITQTDGGGGWAGTDGKLTLVDKDHPLTLAPPQPARATPGLERFQYVLLAPLGRGGKGLAGSGFVILGELDKVVPVSTARFHGLTGTRSGALSWPLTGAVGEVITISYALATDTATLKSAKCIFATTAATLTCSGSTCKCS